MRKTTCAGLVLFLLAACTVAAAQLPYGLHYESALMFMDDIAALHRHNGWPLPDEFHFEYGRVAALAIEKEVARGGIDPQDERRLSEAAIDALERYVTLAGSTGEHYTEALIMLDELEIERPWRRP